MREKHRIVAAWTACVLWMAVIFLMSAMPGDVSGAQSGFITQLLTAWMPSFLEPDAQALDTFETFVRKCAHMAEYAVLFFLLRNALRASGVKRAGLTALLLAAGYAATDEFHQRFVPGRGPSAGDVLIDACGAAAAWGLSWIKGFAAARRKKG